MEYESLIEMYKKATGKEPTDDITKFFKSGIELPLIYKDGKIVIPKGNEHGKSGSQDRR